MLQYRLKEVDALRGLAVVGMLLYHLIWLLNYFGFSRIDLTQVWVELLADFGRGLFLGLVGVSVFLSSRGFKAQSFRAFKIALAASLVSLISWFIFPQEFVRFGVLHAIAVSIIVTRALRARPFFAAILGFILMMIPHFLAWPLMVETFFSGAVFEPIRILIGVPPRDFVSVDYFPLVPWLGVSLWGMVFGWIFYRKRTGTPLVLLALIPGLTWLGRHSLAIYLLHLPFIYFSLWGLSLFF